MALQHLSNFNGFVPSLTGQVIGFVRKPEKFKLNKYVEYKKTDKNVGVYTKLERDVMVRVTNLEDDVWNDGDDAPSGDNGVKVKHSTDSFQCIRRAIPWKLGYEAIDQTDAYPVKPVHIASTVSQVLTRRTMRVWNVLDTSSNWSTHFKTTGELSGISNVDAAKWENASDDPNSPSYLGIWKAINAAIQEIFRDTNSSVEWTDLMLVVNPDLAAKMAMSPEINNYIRETTVAKQQLNGDLSNWNQEWGLPTHYRGLKIIVEDAVKVTEKENVDNSEATTNRSYVKSGTSAVLMSRPGGLDGDLSVPSFSTMQIFHYEGLLQVEAFDKPEHRKVMGRVTASTAEELAAPISGYLMTSVA
jgi:hypothetical protein